MILTTLSVRMEETGEAWVLEMEAVFKQVDTEAEHEESEGKHATVLELLTTDRTAVNRMEDKFSFSPLHYAVQLLGRQRILNWPS